MIRVCLETTNKLRAPKSAKKKRKGYSDKDVVKIRKNLTDLGWDQGHVNRQMEVFSILHDAPELLPENIIKVEPLAVVVMEACPNGTHAHGIGFPVIVVSVNSAGQFSCFHSDGVMGKWTINVTDKPRLASEDEIRRCMDNLTPIQLLHIQRNDLFKNIMDAAMNKQVGVEVSDNPAESVADGAEIELANGRKITVGESAPDSD